MHNRRMLRELLAGLALLSVLVLPAKTFAEPNLIATWSPFITVMTPIPYNSWCTLHLQIKNTGTEGFSQNFKVTFRPTRNRRLVTWQYGSVRSNFLGDIAGDCGAVPNGGVQCWLRPIPRGDATALEIQVRATNVASILEVKVDTENNVSEKYEANTFITAIGVRVPRSNEETPCH
jgi:hypothetical protein